MLLDELLCQAKLLDLESQRYTAGRYPPWALAEQAHGEGPQATQTLRMRAAVWLRGIWAAGVLQSSEPSY